MQKIFSWKRFCEISCWQEVTCYQTDNFELFDWSRLCEKFEFFCITHKIRKHKLSFSPPSSEGTWNYNIKVKCSEELFNELVTYTHEILKQMGID